MVPSGVEEAVPSDAVSGCRGRNEPESRSTASVKLPLKSVVTGTEAQGGGKANRAITGLRYHLFNTSNSIVLAQTESRSSQRSPTEDVRGVSDSAKKKKVFTAQTISDLMFYVSEPLKRKKAARVFTQAVITPWQSQSDRSCSFHRDQGEAPSQTAETF